MSMGLRKGPILPISQTNHPHKSPVNFREMQLSSAGSDGCRQGGRVQSSNTSDMIFDVPAIIEYLSGSTTLVPGTVILTGTPQGVGMAAKLQPRWLRAGDSVTIEIEKIGRLTNTVAFETRH